MMSIFRRIYIPLMALALINFQSQQLAAQEPQEEAMMKTSMNDLLVVGGFGLGGGLMGLSTLSFYDEPFDHFDNVLIGGAVGIIIGVGYVAFSAATKGKKKYIDQAEFKQPDFSTQKRYAWHKEVMITNHGNLEVKKKSLRFFNYQLTF